MPVFLMRKPSPSAHSQVGRRVLGWGAKPCPADPSSGSCRPPSGVCLKAGEEPSSLQRWTQKPQSHGHIQASPGSATHSPGVLPQGPKVGPPAPALPSDDWKHPISTPVSWGSGVKTRSGRELRQLSYTGATVA